MDIWCNFIWNTFDFGKLFHITFHLKLIEKIFIYARLFQKPWALSPTLWKYSNTLSTLLTTGKYGEPLWPTKIKKRIVPQTRVAYRYKNIHSRPNLSSTGESWFLELSPEGIASYGCRWLDNGRSLLFC